MTASIQRALAPVVLKIVDGIPTTSSVDVARQFGKRHDSVLRDIRNLLDELDIEHAHNFVEMFTSVDIGNGATRQSPSYRLTRDGFTLLAMGFTGKKALQFKLAYIDAFNRMEAELRQAATPKEDPAIDVRALMLEGQSSPTVARPPEVDRAIDRQAWNMAHQAFEISREHLQRRVAYKAETGHPQREINPDAAIRAINSASLDDALAHAWLTKIRGLHLLAEEYAYAGQRLLAQLDTIENQQSGLLNTPPL